MPIRPSVVRAPIAVTVELHLAVAGPGGAERVQLRPERGHVVDHCVGALLEDLANRGSRPLEAGIAEVVRIP
eukprot:10304092-Alexandrium_andersonii.AAC.1